MGLASWFGRLPSQIARWLYPALRYTNLMRAIEMHHLAPWTRRVQGWVVLDVGCGHGLYSLALAQRDACLLGCDMSRPALQDAHQTALGMGLAEHTAYVVADGSRLPMAGGAVDLVVCNCVLEHIVDDHRALAGMHRALRPGGLLYLTVDSAEHDLALAFLERLPPKAKALLLNPRVSEAPTVVQGLDDYLTEIYHVQRRYQRAELVSELQELGFDLLDVRSYLTRLGAAHYEAFHLFRGLDTQHGLARLAYMLTSLVLYPFVVLVDSFERQRGVGLVLVARKQ